MNFNIYFFAQNKDYIKQEQHYIKMISTFGQIKLHNLAKVKGLSKFKTTKIPKLALQDYVSNYNIVLDAKGRLLNSMQFAKLISTQAKISFFLGNAFGFASDVKVLMQETLSLSKLTFSHDIARLVLLEQLYRAFSINNNHPYHKI